MKRRSSCSLVEAFEAALAPPQTRAGTERWEIDETQPRFGPSGLPDLGMQHKSRR
jgi:hypothetical protein